MGRVTTRETLEIIGPEATGRPQPVVARILDRLPPRRLDRGHTSEEAVELLTKLRAGEHFAPSSGPSGRDDRCSMPGPALQFGLTKRGAIRGSNTDLEKRTAPRDSAGEGRIPDSIDGQRRQEHRTDAMFAASPKGAHHVDEESAWEPGS